MEYHQPKIEPGLGSTDHKNLDDLSIHELVSLLRIAFLTEDFDRVEEVLVNRDKTLQTEILRLQEMVELEKLTRFQAEEDLRKKEELCERGKIAQNNYENLLKEVKKNTNLADRETIGELRKKNADLELEVCELRKLKKKWVDDSNALAQLIVKNSELEKSMKKNNEALADPGINVSEDRDKENVGDYEIDNDTMEPNPLERNEPPSRRRKIAQAALSVSRIRGRDGHIHRRLPDGSTVPTHLYQQELEALQAVNPVAPHVPPHPAFPGGPSDTSLLVRYQNHVAQHLWEGEERRPKKELKVAAHGSKLIGWVPHMLPPQMEQWISQSGLSSLQRTSLSRIDTNLLSVFAERWHPETSSFHMTFGEMTITLDDVSCLLHIPIRGKLCIPTEGITDSDAISLAIRLMGISLEDASEEIRLSRGPYYRLEWLKIQFVRLQAEGRFDCAARVYILLILGCTILTDKTFTLVEAKYLPLFEDLDRCGKYCWGAAALVTLYRYLGDASFYSCKQLDGYASLLQCWIHEYFPTIVKRGFSKIAGVGSPLPRAMKWCYKQSTRKVDEIRAVLDGLTPGDVIWRPFEDHRQHKPFDNISLYRGGLRWYDTSVLYLPDRCLRQFGYRQYVPSHPPDIDALDIVFDWVSCHVSIRQVIQLLQFADVPYDTVAEYLTWYYTVSHPRLIPPPQGEDKEVPVPEFDDGPSDPRLWHILHELNRYLQRHRAEEDDDEYVEIFRALRLAQGGPLPQGGPVPQDDA